MHNGVSTSPPAPYLDALLPALDNYIPHLLRLIEACKSDTPIEPKEPNRFQTEEVPEQTRDFLRCQDEDEASRKRLLQEVFKQADQAKDVKLKDALMALFDWLNADTTGRAGLYTKFFSFLLQLEAASNHWASTGAAVILSPAFEDNLFAAEPTGDIGPLAVSSGFESMGILRTWHTEIKMNKHLLEANCNNLVREVAEALQRWNVSRMEIIQMCADAVANLQRVEGECAAKYGRQVEGYKHLKEHYLGRMDLRTGMVGEMEKYTAEIAANLKKIIDLARQYKKTGDDITRDSMTHIRESEGERNACEEELRTARNNNAYYAKVREGMDKGLAVLNEAQEADKRAFDAPLKTVDKALKRVEVCHDECHLSVGRALAQQERDLPRNIESAKRRLEQADTQAKTFENAREDYMAAMVEEEFQSNLQSLQVNARTQQMMLQRMEDKLRQTRENHVKLQRDFSPFGNNKEAPPQASGLPHGGGPQAFQRPAGAQGANTVNFQPQHAPPQQPTGQKANSQGFTPMAWAATPPIPQATPWATPTAPLPAHGGGFGHAGFGHPGFGHPGLQNNQQQAGYQQQPGFNAQPGFPQPPPPAGYNPHNPTPAQ